MSPEEFFRKTSNHPGDSPHYSPDLVPCNFCLFPKLKSPLQEKRFQTADEVQENTMEQLMATGRTVWGPKVPPLKGTEASLSHAQCFLYLVSSSINVSIFHSAWLDSFWTYLLCQSIIFKKLESIAHVHTEQLMYIDSYELHMEWVHVKNLIHQWKN